jgi:Ca2+-binding EF-hand superfamily protein
MRASDATPEPGPHRPGFFLRAMSCMTMSCIAMPMSAHAQVGATSDYLSRMDADHDGRISLAEYQDWLSYAFDAMDRNHDGTLAVDELPGGKGKPVTRAEYRARLAATFNKQDANRDGSLDARELASPPR